MKILIVSNLYPPIVYGGYELLCSQVVDGFRARGHDVAVLTSSFMAETCREDPDVHRILDLTTRFPRPGESVGEVDFSLGRMETVGRRNRTLTARLLHDGDFDLVFAWNLNRLTLGPLYAAHDAGIPHCYSINDEHPRQFVASRQNSTREQLRGLAERWVCRTATLRGLAPFPITIISEATKRKLIGFGLPFEQSEVIHQGIPLEEFAYRPLARPDATTRLRVAYVGQLSRAKGVMCLIEAFARATSASSASAELDIIGSGVADFEAALRERVEKLRLQDKVRFMGQLPHHEIPAQMHNHHVLVFPSEWDEPFGLSHLEAMASGCAVVSTLTGGSAELIRHSDNGLAFTAGVVQELGDCLRVLMEHEAIRAGLLPRARAWVERHHSSTLYLDNLEGFAMRALEHSESLDTHLVEAS